MRKVLYLLALTLFVSCSGNSILNSVTKEIGEPATTKQFGEKETHYTWAKISLKNKDVLKNALDKTVGILPTKKVEFEPQTDESGNSIPGAYSTYYVWETAQSVTELDYNYTMSDPNNMEVVLTVTNK